MFVFFSQFIHVFFFNSVFKSTPMHELVVELYQDVNIKECNLMWKEWKNSKILPFEYASFILNKVFFKINK